MFVVDGTAQRILRATAATLSWQGRDQYGEPADPGTVTVTVVRSDGTSVLAAGTATTGTGKDLRTVSLTAAQTAQLDVLFATWTVSGVDVATTRHDIVGGYYYDADALRINEPTTATGSNTQIVDVIRDRDYVETVIEQVTGKAFVPRFDVAWIPGNPTCHVTLPRWYLRAVRWLTLWSSNTASTVFDAASVAAIRPDRAGIINLDMSTAGYMIEIGFEHGADGPPFDVAREAITFARVQSKRGETKIGAAATSQRLPDGGFITLATPGTGEWHTGIPTVDDMLKRYRRREPQIA